MSEPTPSSKAVEASLASRFWRGQARRVRWHYTLAWAVLAFGRWVIGLSLPVVALILLIRWRGHDPAQEFPFPLGSLQPFLPLLWAVPLGAALLLALSGASHHRLLTERDALARLDRSLRLRGRLTAAHAGATDWPAPLSSPDDGYRIRWQPTILAVATSLVALGLVTFLPLPRSDQSEPATLPPPESHLALRELLDQAHRSGLFAEEDLQRLAAEADRLAADPDQWYDQARLEAVQSLLQHQRGELARQAQRLAELSSALDALVTDAAQLSPQQRYELQQRAQQALAETDTAEPALDPHLQQALQDALAQLAEAGGGEDSLAGINPGQREQLERLFAEHSEALEQLIAGMGLTQPGVGPGIPGVGGEDGGRDGESVPLELVGDGTPRVDEQGKGPTALSRSGGHNGPSGALVERRNTTPEAEDLDLGVREGGATAAEASGGDLLRDNDFLPAERRLLERLYQEPQNTQDS